MSPSTVTYARRSSDREVHHLSVEQQLEELRRLAIQRNLDLALEVG